MNLKEMKARLRAIKDEAAKVPEGDIETLNKLTDEAVELSAKIEEAEARKHLSDLANAGVEEASDRAEVETITDEASKRGKQLKSGAKVTYKDAITSESVAFPQHNANDVNPGFNDVSSLVDLVKIVPLKGGESYRRGFEKSNGVGAYTAENTDYNEIEPKFGYAEMTKTKITAYCEEPEEISRLAPADYDGVISTSTERAVKKYLSRQILVGEGGSGELVGIFYNPSDEDDDIIDRDTDIEISAIDETTLDEIIYSYGGDEDVEDVAYLILSKADLKAFATARNADGNKAYTIVHHGNTGTIDGVPYIINSICGSVSLESTEDGAYCMAYGSLQNYELPVFSDMEVQRSTEYKFKQGQIAHRASIFAGGNVAAYNGFVRVKKAATTA